MANRSEREPRASRCASAPVGVRFHLECPSIVGAELRVITVIVSGCISVREAAHQVRDTRDPP